MEALSGTEDLLVLVAMSGGGKRIQLGFPEQPPFLEQPSACAQAVHENGALGLGEGKDPKSHPRKLGAHGLRGNCAGRCLASQPSLIARQA